MIFNLKEGIVKKEHFNSDGKIFAVSFWEDNKIVFFYSIPPGCSMQKAEEDCRCFLRAKGLLKD